MLVVVSRPEMVAGELLQLETAAMNLLFKEGLVLLHLRKPTAGLADLALLLEAISEKDRCKIVVHPPRKVSEELDTHSAMINLLEWMSYSGLHRFHVSGWLRKLLEKEGKLALLQSAPNFIYSTGLHHPGELCQLSGGALRQPDYAYLLVSPLLNSIAKKGYLGNPVLWQMPAKARLAERAGPDEINNNLNNHLKLIAMGGIQEGYFPAVLEAGFDGVAMLGGIWSRLSEKSSVTWTEKTALQFKRCQNLWIQLNKL